MILLYIFSRITSYQCYSENWFLLSNSTSQQEQISAVEFCLILRTREIRRKEGNMANLSKMIVMYPYSYTSAACHSPVDSHPIINMLSGFFVSGLPFQAIESRKLFGFRSNQRMLAMMTYCTLTALSKKQIQDENTFADPSQGLFVIADERNWAAYYSSWGFRRKTSFHCKSQLRPSLIDLFWTWNQCPHHK